MAKKLDRRSFLRNTALAGAALAAPSIEKIEAAPALHTSSGFGKDKLRLGFIGTGYAPRPYTGSTVFVRMFYLF